MVIEGSKSRGAGVREWEFVYIRGYLLVCIYLNCSCSQSFCWVLCCNAVPYHSRVAFCNYCSIKHTTRRSSSKKSLSPIHTRRTYRWKRKRGSHPRFETPSPSTKPAQLINKQGGTNHQLDLQQPENLGAQSTDNGIVPNLRWSFSDARTRIFNGGWTREQVISDLPGSHDIAGAQQHLKKGASRELHWHRVVS